MNTRRVAEGSYDSLDMRAIGAPSIAIGETTAASDSTGSFRTGTLIDDWGLGYEMEYVPRDTVTSCGGRVETRSSLPRAREPRQQRRSEPRCRRADMRRI